MNAAKLRALAASLTVAVAGGVFCLGEADAGVATTRHNLSTSGSGTIKSTTESEICVFCHAPHNTSPLGQLWNRRTSTASYSPYASSTLKSSPGQPNGASLLCLSCHDGTIALGELLSRPSLVPMTGAITGDRLLGTNLRDDHPVSFVYDAALRAANGQLADPATLVRPLAVRLDAGGRMQCTACHDPHDDTNGKFLVAPNTASALCVTCHVKQYWTGSDHRNSTRTWNGAGTNPWPHTSGTTVAANACESCHRPHTAGGSQRLLNYSVEENNCLTCHNGNVALKNIQTELNKASGHSVASFAGIHDAAETDPVSNAHVECVDCHNPHAVNSTAGSAPGGTTTPTLPGSLIGMRGIGIGGGPASPAATQYEICLRCHADGAGNTPIPRTQRQIAQNNKRLEFQATNPSFHPVAAAGRSTNVPSLISPWTTASRVMCTDCHNNNAGPYSTGTGTTPSGTGVNGPHGSTFPLLLERNYAVADNTSESAAAYALCYKCHNRTSILSDVTFRLHNKHIVGERAPCNVCHDPHGINGAQGTTANNSRLINFDTSIVRPNNGVLRWTRVGTTQGNCTLTCHGANHSNWNY
ncbi:MAG TPA: cytochrome c3 family protein [Usitatibacter sp.]|nr:cytochrome c3 family protein [Usitatibacter sp.]